MADIVDIVAVAIRDFGLRQPAVFGRIDDIMGEWGYGLLPGGEQVQMVWRCRVAVDWPEEWANNHTWPHGDIFDARSSAALATQIAMESVEGAATAFCQPVCDFMRRWQWVGIEEPGKSCPAEPGCSSSRRDNVKPSKTSRRKARRRRAKAKRPLAAFTLSTTTTAAPAKPQDTATAALHPSLAPYPPLDPTDTLPKNSSPPNLGRELQGDKVAPPTMSYLVAHE